VSAISEPDVLDLLMRLVEKSLVSYEEDNQGRGRYRLLETVRQYARKKLGSDPERESLRRQHRDHYLSVVQEAGGQLEGPQQRQWLDRLELEHDNVRAALEWCEQDDGAGLAGLRLVGSLQKFWDVRGYFMEGRERYRAALAHSGGQERTRERAQALHGAGLLAHLQADYETARALYAEALSIRQELDDRQGVAGSWLNLGNMALEHGDYASARAHFEQAGAATQGLGSPGQLTLANAMNGLGIASNEQGDNGAAESYYEQALTIFRALGNLSYAANTLSNLGNAARARGDPGKARACYEESLAIRRALGDKRGIAVVLTNLGGLACEQGALAVAWEPFAECLRVCREIGDRRLAAFGLEGMSTLAQARGEPRRAIQLFGAAIALRGAIGSPLPPVELAQHEGRIRDLRNVLGEEAFERSVTTGRALSWERAIACALEEPA
jgi:tetratricopeptide (TPR) repeat protein